MKHRKALFGFLVVVCFCMQAFANPPIMDVYGTNEKVAAKIIGQFGKAIEEYAQCYSAENRLKPKCNPEQQAARKQKIISGIEKKGNFAYVDVCVVTYPDMRMFVTIDLVENQDKKRSEHLSHFILKNVNKNFTKDKNVENLLSHWKRYEEIELEIFYRKEARPLKNCPAYHCSLGFEDPELKKYQAIFEKEVPKNKRKLIEILRADPDEQRRSAAAYLLAHIENGYELIDILTSSLSDPSKEVRNAVMRVLGSTLAIVKPVNFNIDPIIQALDSPMLTDRNKALCMVMALSEQPQYARYVARHAGVSLMASLKMMQPNLHGNAYGVLQKISRKSYGDRDYVLWQNWLAEQSQG